MAGLDDRDDYGAEEYEAGLVGDADGNGANESGAEAREVFARTVTGAGDRPRLGFTAEDLVLGGRRRVRRRRVGAALAGTASVAAVAVAATAIGVGRAASPASDSSPAARDAKLANAAIGKIYDELDPWGNHLNAGGKKRDVDYFLQSGGGQCDAAAHVLDAYGFEEAWTADGKGVGPRNGSDTSPWVHVTVLIAASSGQVGQFLPGAGWGPVSKQTMADDGSVVQMASAAGGHEVKAVRTFTDQRQVIVMAEDESVVTPPAGAPAAKPTEPFPFTADKLGAVVAGLSQPLPFADGYRPQGPCGAGGR